MAERDETSIWKKEISLRRKPKPATGDAAPAMPQSVDVPPAAKAETSMWKKEITFRRKPKAEPGLPVQAPAQQAPAQEPVSPSAPVYRPTPVEAAGPIVPADLPPVTAPVTPVAQQPVTPPGPAPVTPVAQQPVLPPVTPVAQQPVLSPVTPPATSQPAVPPPAFAPVPAPAAQSFPPVPSGSETVAPKHEVAAVVVAAQVPTREIEAPAPRLETDGQPEAKLEPEQQPEPEPALVADPEPAPEPEPTPEPLSRRQRRGARRVAAALAKEQKKSAKRNGKVAKGTHGELVGLKIGASQIAAAQVINKGGPRIVRMARMPLQRGVVVGGELREPEELASSLKTFFRKNKLPRNCVRLGISNNRIGVRTFEITGIDDPHQLANAVRFRAQETLPIPLEEAVLDHRILDDWVGDDGVRVCRVLLVVAHRDLVERYVAACRKAGLKLVGIDLEAFALLRALSDPARPPGEDAAVVCVSIGHDRSTLAVSDGRTCELTRVLAWGGSALDSALARVLDQTPSAVVPIKHALSLAEEGEGAGLDARHADEARKAMVVELQSFARELVASLRFYQEQPNSRGIVEILITGGAAACGGLASELERLMGIPVRVADPLTRVKASRKLDAGDDGSSSAASMAVAVGLGIED